jgi:dTDP-4-amino-4,6-dideoxygalactose transaminase
MIGPFAPFRTIGDQEILDAATTAAQPLSGYLAGQERGGWRVRRLEDVWAETFHVKHAIACNSATSGLLAAAFAVGLGPGDTFVCPAMTMSATAAAPMFTGATPFFQDVSDKDFGLICRPMPDTTRAIFTTNMFGHASELARNEWSAGTNDPIYLIEDNAQSPFAMANGRYTGTFASIGVWSLNVHKPIQCGEGGVVTTNDDALAGRLRDFINHGENAGGPIGLNLRMPEISAAVALVQLRRGQQIIAGRVEQAEAIIAAIGDIPGLRPPVVHEGCTHVYYTIPFLIDRNRTEFCAELRASGVPIKEGYVDPLYRMPAFAQFARPCLVAENLQDRWLFYFENCAWSPTSEQIEQIGAAFRKAAEKVL